MNAPSRSKPIRSLLVVPFGATNPRSGGGQRTAIMFAALRDLGPTTIAYLTGREEEDATEFFPGAVAVKTITAAQFSAPQNDLKSKLHRAITGFVMPWRQCAADVALHEQITQLQTTIQADVIVFRYARGFLNAGLASTASCPIIVDVDDRDDHRLFTQVARKISTIAAKVIYKPYLRMTLYPALRKGLSKASVVLFTKDADRISLSSAQTDILPNVPFNTPSAAFDAKPSKGRHILIVASIEHRPNADGIAWFLSHCWPALAQDNPDTRLRLVGVGDWSEVKSAFPDMTRVDFAGYVDNIEDEYAQARLAISPIFNGAGSQIKIIEALSFGRPVVCSRFAGNSFTKEVTQKLAIASDATAFIAACQRFLDDPLYADEIGNQSQMAQLATYSKSSAVRKISSIVQNITSPALQPELSS